MAFAVVLAGCSGAGDKSVDGEVLVSAAASLTNAFGAIEVAFEEANPGVDVVLNLGSSSGLREQILEGAPVDVFASANTSNMDQVVEAGQTGGQARVFARNSLQIAVPTDNPAGVIGLADFASEELLVGLCAEGVPCGDLGRQVLEKAGITPSIDSNEPDVRALLTKIEAGELDAGLVYVTDLISTEGGVEGVEIPQSQNLATGYPIAVLANAPNPDGARAFVDFVVSDQGQAIMSEYGFIAP
ncbi:MAG TPA: molybdate ABC transporter substrate-binding protein [Acidimicrobiia bacterium]|nr:molybdate ABC transporter substrate-binding protein [Acidimicrobiia bacterium]